MENIKDIFISYKNDGEGRYFAEKLSNILKEQGYSVYYNPDEQHAGSFPTRLREAVTNCNDFLLVLSQACLDQLIRHEKVDWVREEIKIAEENGKNIIPLLMPGVTMPKDKDDMPEDLQFLPHEDAVNVSDPFNKSPLDCLLGYIKSKPANTEKYKDVYHSNNSYNLEDSIGMIEKKALNGDFSAMYELATFYMYCLGEQNISEATRWYKEILKSDNDELRSHALSGLAGLYFSGAIPGEEQSFTKAFELREEAAKHNKNAAMQNAAMRRIGSGCEFDFFKVEKGFEQLTKIDSISVKEQAEFYLTYGKFDKAIALYKQIQNKMPSAAYQLGLLYKLGVHCDPPIPDCFRAADCFRRASNKGHVLSSYELGMLYYNPPMCDFEKDFEQAVKYFKIAADEGITEAQYKLGWMYRFGLGCDVDVEKAIKYEEMAAKQGHTGGCGQLAYLYQIKGHINYQKAFKYAKLAADAGYAHGAYMCGNFLFFGRGCEPNISEALKYYNFAYQHGSYEAKLMIDRIEMRNKNE